MKTILIFRISNIVKWECVLFMCDLLFLSYKKVCMCSYPTSRFNAHSNNKSLALGEKDLALCRGNLSVEELNERLLAFIRPVRVCVHNIAFIFRDLKAVSVKEALHITVFEKVSNLIVVERLENGLDLKIVGITSFALLKFSFSGFFPAWHVSYCSF